MNKSWVAILPLTASFAAFSAAHAEDCLPEVAQQQEEIMKRASDDAVELARDVYKRKEATFGELSCLDDIMNSGSDIFFKPPSLGDLMNRLKTYACSAADQAFNQISAPLNQSGNLNLPIDDVLPGLNMGSIGVGYGTRIRQGANSPVEVRGYDGMVQSKERAEGVYREIFGE